MLDSSLILFFLILELDPPYILAYSEMSAGSRSNHCIKWYIGYGLTDKRFDGGSHTTGVSTQPSTNAYLRSSRRYTVLRSKGTWSNAK